MLECARVVVAVVTGLTKRATTVFYAEARAAARASGDATRSS
jgi:hypothetical protein